MYHVITTGIVSLILYLISLTLYRNGFYSRSLHLKIWNILLAVTFILTASAGILLALQTNYKWEIPFLKTILRWHVETGIGLSFTGLYHFIWHFGYFFRAEKDADEEVLVMVSEKRTPAHFAVNLFIIGFVSSSVQLLLMREMMNISGGYELITGTFLASWLTGSAAGSYSARSSGFSNSGKLNIAFGLAPVISVILLLLLSRTMMSTGETPSFLASIILTLIVLFPCTFISGYAFLKILNSARSTGKHNAGKLYAVETAGGAAAGLIVAFYGSGILNTYQMLIIIILLFFYYAYAAFFSKGKRIIVRSLPVVTGLIIIVIAVNPDRAVRQILLPAVRVTGTHDTPYGNITTGEYGGERSTFYNHRILKWESNETDREENVHYALIQRKEIRNLLIVSGDIGSVLPEVLKHKVSSIWFIERDPELLDMHDIQEIPEGITLHIESEDAFRFIRRTPELFDAVLLILPPPSTLMLNRFYTTDFFTEVRKKMTDNGILMCSPGSGETYFNRESAILYSSIFKSLSAVFRNVLPIVGNKLFYISSDGEISHEIAGMIDSRGLVNSYVSSNFLYDDLIKMRSDEFLGTIDKNARQNTLAVPVACFHFQRFNLSKTTSEKIPAFILIALVFVTPVLFIRKQNLIMLSAAGALSGFEIVLLLTLQSTAGNMYQATGIIIAGVMTGLAAGAGSSISPGRIVSVTGASVAAILFYGVTGLAFNNILNIHSNALVILILICLSLIPSFLTGQMFRLLTGNGIKSLSPSAVYSSDLAGSALGFIAISSLSLPLIGIQNTLFLISGLIFTGYILGTITNK